MTRSLSRFTLVASLLVSLAALSQTEAPPPGPQPSAVGASVSTAPLTPGPGEAANRKPSLSDSSQLFGLGPQGFYLGNEKSPFQLRLRGVVQADGRDFPDTKPITPSTFLVRRARIYIEGSVAQVADFRLLPEFGQGKFQLLDAFVDLHPIPGGFVKLRLGKSKTPLGLERLVTEQNLRFIERGLPSDLIPDRDVGASLHGDFLRALVQYEAGVFDGTLDNGNVDTDSDGEKDFVARLVFQPFRPLRSRWLDDIGLGAGYSVGRAYGSVTNTLLPTLVTGGQNAFFTYLSSTTTPANTVFAHGEHARFSPQAYAFVGPVGALFEWVEDLQTVAKGSKVGRIRSTAWQAQAYWVLTGEHGNLDGVDPDRPFSWAQHHYGAVELIGRYGQVDVGRTAFSEGFADPTKSARDAYAWAGGVNWYLVRCLKLAVNYEQTHFVGGNGAKSRTPEHALLARVQLAF